MSMIIDRPERVPSRLWLAASILIVIPTMLSASTGAANPISPTRISTIQIPRAIEQRELRLSLPLARTSRFVDIRHIAEEQTCEQVEDPVALATPDPLSIPPGHGKRVQVSFIIGTDGRVHSPLILESAGLSGDRRVIDTVRTWRYRPATCNGVPTETEGKIEFSVR